MVSGELIFLNFLLGLLATFSPCLFPLLPSYVALSVRSNHSQKTTFVSSLFLILGILVVFFTMGIISSNIGNFLLRNYTAFARFQAILLISAGIFMIKTPSIFYRIKLPSVIEKRIYNEEQSNPYMLNFTVGLSFTIIAAPCASGIFLFAWGNLIELDLLSQFILVLSFSIGAGLPFIVMAMYIPRIRGQQVESLFSAREKLSLILGIILIFVGILLYNEIGQISFASVT